MSKTYYSFDQISWTEQEPKEPYLILTTYIDTDKKYLYITLDKKQIEASKNGYQMFNPLGLLFDNENDKDENDRDTALPVKRFKNYNHEWWTGYCPSCNEMISYNFQNGDIEGNRKHYCFKCGQLCDFEDI